MTIIKRYILPILFALILAVAGIGFNSQPVQASSQVIFAGTNSALSADGTRRYNCVAGGGTWQTSAFSRSQIATSAGKLKNLYVSLRNPADGTAMAAGSGSDDTYTFTLYVNGNPSSLTCATVQTATSNNDVNHQVDIVAGDIISLSYIASGSPSNAPYVNWSTVFSGSTAKESLMLGSAYTTNTATAYVPIMHSAASSSSTSLPVTVVCPTNGTIRNLWVMLSADPGPDPDAYTFTLMKDTSGDGTLADTTLTCSITSATLPDRSGSDVTHTVSVSAGDILALKVVPIDSPTVTPYIEYGMTFVADTDGESILVGASSTNLSTANPRYNNVIVGNYGLGWDATEINMQQLGQICVIKKLYVNLTGSPYQNNAVDNYTFTFRKNAISQAITFSIANTNTKGSDLINTVTLTAGDFVSLMCVPNSSPTARQAYWGLVCYIDPFPYIPKINYYVKLLAQ